MGKLELNGTGKKRPGRHKTERKGTVTRKLGASPQEWDPAEHNQVKAGRNCRNYTTHADSRGTQKPTKLKFYTDTKTKYRVQGLQT